MVKIAGHQFCLLQHHCWDKRKRLRTKIKADTPPPPPTRQTGVSLQTGCSLEPRCTPPPQGGGGWLCPTRLPRGAWGGTREGGQMCCSAADGSTGLSHTPSGVALEVAEGTGWLLDAQACHSCQSPLPPCQGRPALSQQNCQAFHSHLFIKAAFFFLFPQEQSWVSIPDSAPS